MRLGVDVGIDPDADAGTVALRQRHRVQYIEFGIAFDVETADAGSQRLLHLCACLADTGKNDFRGLGANRQDTFQFAARHDVKATTGIGKHTQHAER